MDLVAGVRKEGSRYVRPRPPLPPKIYLPTDPLLQRRPRRLQVGRRQRLPAPRELSRPLAHGACVLPGPRATAASTPRIRLPFRLPSRVHVLIFGGGFSLAVGRWQKHRDLSWYAKGDASRAALDAAAARKEEVRRIQEAEGDALREALGYPVEKRGAGMGMGMGMGTGTGANAVVVAEAEEEGGRSLGMNERIGGEGDLEMEMSSRRDRDHERRRGRHEDGKHTAHGRRGQEGRERQREGTARRRSRSRSYERRRDDLSSSRTHERASKRRSRSRSRDRRRETARQLSRDKIPARRSRSRSYDRRRDPERRRDSPRRRSRSPHLRRRDGYGEGRY
ncbi:RRM [Xylographa bjoerkii]|nr:RRM [Xylographa bjoerkii]